MALQANSVTTASISSATTTTIVTAGTGERVYVYYVGVDTQTSGTTWVLDVKGSGGTVRVGTFDASAVGHKEGIPSVGDKALQGIALPVGESLVVVSTGTPGASTVTVIYELRGGAF